MHNISLSGFSKEKLGELRRNIVYLFNVYIAIYKYIYFLSSLFLEFRGGILCIFHFDLSKINVYRSEEKWHATYS